MKILYPPIDKKLSQILLRNQPKIKVKFAYKHIFVLESNLENTIDLFEMNHIKSLLVNKILL